MDSSKMAKDMDSEYIIIKMETSIQEIGNATVNKAQEKL